MLAPEGKAILLSATVAGVFSVAGGWVLGVHVLKIASVVVLLFLALCIIFFRDPERQSPEGENLILSPADGKVVFVGSVNGSDGPMKQVSIFLSIFDVHANRVPITGLVKKVRYSKGRFLAAFKNEASDVNEQMEIHIEDNRMAVTVKQIAGIVARRVICYLREGDRVRRGDRLGFIRFGSRTDLLLSAGVEIHVEEGDRVRGGETIIGEMI